LAEANGLSGEAALIEGSFLSLPAGITRNTQNANTFQPFNPAEAIGDVSPAIPQPEAGDNCGVFGQILLTVIAVAVTVVTAGAGAAAVTPGLTLAQGITAAATGTLATSAGLGTGIEAGAVGGAAAGAPGSAASQEVAVATGLQNKFSFAGIAAAGVGAAVAGAVSSNIPGAAEFDNNGNFQRASIGNRIISSTAGGIADAATRSALTGNSFGDSLRAATPNIIASAVGQLLADRLIGDTIDQAEETPTDTSNPVGGGTGTSGNPSSGSGSNPSNSSNTPLPPIPDGARVLDKVIVTPNGASQPQPGSFASAVQGLNFLLSAIGNVRGQSAFENRNTGAGRRVSLQTQAERRFAAGVAQGELDFARNQRRLNSPFQNRDVIDSSDFLSLEARERNLANSLPGELRAIAGAEKARQTAQFFADAASLPLEFTAVGSIGAIATDYITTGEVSPLVALEALPAAKFIPGVGKAADVVGRQLNSAFTSLARNAASSAARIPGAIGAAPNIRILSRISDSPFAVRQAQALSQQAQRDVDNLVAQLKAGNLTAGIGPRQLGDGFVELRGRNAGRVIVKQTSATEFTVVGKFQAHVRGDAQNSRIIQRLIEEFDN
ncbi:MAG: hypothetical protein AAGA08_16620, partial [Pseudomonadota bacterium]